MPAIRDDVPGRERAATGRLCTRSLTSRLAAAEILSGFAWPGRLGKYLAGCEAELFRLGHESAVATENPLMGVPSC